MINVINGDGPGYSYLSVVPNSDHTLVRLVVGANYNNALAEYFNKYSLGQLIELLQDIHGEMEAPVET
jgi:hypothetical protein